MVALYKRNALDSGETNESRIRHYTDCSLRSIDPSTVAFPLINSTHSQRSTKFAWPKVYNDITLDVESSENYFTFKITLKSFHFTLTPHKMCLF